MVGRYRGRRVRGCYHQSRALRRRSLLQMLETGIYPLGNTNRLRAQYIEVFATNAVAFTNAIWQAHQELSAPP